MEDKDKDNLELEPKKEPVKVEFDDNQKEHVNKLIQDRLARQKDTLEKQLEKTFDERLQSELAKLRTELAPKDDKGKDKDADPVEQAKEQARKYIEEEQRKAQVADQKRAEAEKKAQQLETEFARVRKQDVIRKAMAESGYKFHAPEMVLSLTEQFIDTDSEGNYVVKDEKGNIRENSSLDPMTPEQLYADWGKTNPWAVEAEVVPGTGAKPGSPTKTHTVSKKSDFKSDKDKSDYIDKYGMDKYLDLPN
jgi:hypothetical protein